MLLNKSNIIKRIIENIELFDEFDKVYLFGSILETDKQSNDIDILLLYSAFKTQMQEDASQICKHLESVSGYPVDITILSFQEEKDTKFIDRLNNKYFCIK